MKPPRHIEIPRPVAAVLILLSGVLLGGTVLVWTMTDLWTATAERDAQAEIVGRSLAQRSVRAPTNADAPASLTIGASSPTLAAARLDDVLRAVAAQVGGAVLSSRAEAAARDSGPPNHLTAQAVIDGRIEALQALLHRFETGSPMVVVDGLTLEPAPTSVGDAQAPLLRATLTLSAYWAETPR